MKRLCGQDGFNASWVVAGGARAEGFKKKKKIVKNALKSVFFYTGCKTHILNNTRGRESA